MEEVSLVLSTSFGKKVKSDYLYIRGTLLEMPQIKS
jgi:hypothetical protein